MDLIPAPEGAGPRDPKRKGGIALFMVIAAMTVLSLLVTEFVYIAQVNQRMAFDGLDQVRALYLAKSGFKISLLRLKAYQNVKSLLAGNAGAAAAVPRAMLEKVWNFPFIYPFPTALPGLTMTQKDEIAKFEKESGLTGTFTANIESESSRYNLNLLLASFVPKPQPSGTPRPSGQPTPSPSPTPGSAEAAQFDPAAARKGLADLLFQLLNAKFQSDPDFASEYRDTKVEELTDNIVAWVDKTYEKPSRWPSDQIAPKRAPFYSLQELRMVPGMDDGLYALFAPNLTVTATPGMNVNTIRDSTLKALLPEASAEELQEFFKFRDSEEEDHSFKDADAFFKYVQEHMRAYRGNTGTQGLQDEFKKRNIRIVTDESVFRVVVQAQVNQATRRIEALVQFTEKASTPASPGGPKKAENAPAAKPDSGLKITFMRLL